MVPGTVCGCTMQDPSSDCKVPTKVPIDKRSDNLLKVLLPSSYKAHLLTARSRLSLLYLPLTFSGWLFIGSQLLAAEIHAKGWRVQYQFANDNRRNSTSYRTEYGAAYTIWHSLYRVWFHTRTRYASWGLPRTLVEELSGGVGVRP